MPVVFRGIMRFTGWRKPISISGAGKAVGVILRRRPCFLCPFIPRRAFRNPRPERTSQPGDLPLRRLAKLGAFAVAPRNKKTAEFKIYPGAPQGFHADYRASYRKQAADDARAQMQSWFRKHGVLG